MASFDDLPDDILLLVFQYLCHRNYLLKLFDVCRRFRRVCSDARLRTDFVTDEDLAALSAEELERFLKPGLRHLHICTDAELGIRKENAAKVKALLPRLDRLSLRFVVFPDCFEHEARRVFISTTSELSDAEEVELIGSGQPIYVWPNDRIGDSREELCDKFLLGELLKPDGSCCRLTVSNASDLDLRGTLDGFNFRMFRYPNTDLKAITYDEDGRLLREALGKTHNFKNLFSHGKRKKKKFRRWYKNYSMCFTRKKDEVLECVLRLEW